YHDLNSSGHKQPPKISPDDFPPLPSPMQHHLDITPQPQKPPRLPLIQNLRRQELRRRKIPYKKKWSPRIEKSSISKSVAIEIPHPNNKINKPQDRYLRSVADFRNLQDRTKRDVSSARDYAIQKFASDLIESVDNLDRALSTVPPSKLAPQNSDPDAKLEEKDYNKDLANLYDGLKMTETILMGTLKKHGMERFDPSEGEGEAFNPNLHEATFQTKVEGKEDGKVFMTQQKGFLLHGRVLRAAKVGVVKNS
ncbi:MAG: hypothetical protein Q9183_004303, partial [Haloplaca sp. 2 TL-2023]